MSRTYRKQSGNRYWRDAHRSKFNFTLGYNRRFFALKEPAVPYTREEVEKELQDDIIKYEKKDGYSWDPISQAVKWHSNKMVRQGNRMELHRVMQDPENYDYNRDHDMRKRSLWWVYD